MDSIILADQYIMSTIWSKSGLGNYIYNVVNKMDFEVSVYEDVIKGQSPESWGHKGEICGFLVSTENAAERIPFYTICFGHSLKWKTDFPLRQRWRFNLRISESNNLVILDICFKASRDLLQSKLSPRGLYFRYINAFSTANIISLSRVMEAATLGL